MSRLFQGAPAVTQPHGFLDISRLAVPKTYKLFIGGAIVLLVLGALFLLLGRLGLDRLPGDLVFRRGNFTVYFPIGLMILLSVVGTILLNLFFLR